MTAKREWPGKLKALKKEPRPLTPAECDELITLLGGTTRPNHRPPITVFGMNLRRSRWGGIASVVFSFLKNAERLKKLEVELQELSEPGYLKNILAKVPSGNRAEAERVAKENIAAELEYLKNSIAKLRPISAKNRAEAERMAVEWFKARGCALTKKHIQNELDALRRNAELKKLGLAEWEILINGK